MRFSPMFVVFTLAACSPDSNYASSSVPTSSSANTDPPPFEDVVADVDMPQQGAFAALLEQAKKTPGTTVEAIESPSTFTSRENGGQATLYRVEPAGDRSVVRLRHRISSGDIAEIRRWITMIYGTKLIGEVRQVAVAAPRSPSTPNPNPGSASTGSGGSVHVSGYYRKDGTYVKPYTRRK